MKETKIFAAYLPQYHETNDNNLFWGDGFTDWVGVKNAKSLFEGHKQPKVPMNNNYYDLSDYNVIKWQAELAKKYGVTGFNIYHYWFKNGKQELEKPAELLLSHNDIDIEFFFTWDNVAWKRTWSDIQGNDWAPIYEKNEKKGPSVLVEFEYGTEKCWKQHFDYLLPFFKDPRYLKINNKPVFAFMTTFDVETLSNMGKYWDVLAKEYGFDGVYLLSQKSFYREKIEMNNKFIYEPITSAWGKRKSIETHLKKFFINRSRSNGAAKYIYDYDKVWKKIINRSKKQKGIVGSFVKYDDTPRRGKDAGIIINDSPSKFEKYFSELYRICCEKNHDIVLLTAWNEWGEGAYLEPDEENGFGYLEALKKAKQSVMDTLQGRN